MRKRLPLARRRILTTETILALSRRCLPSVRRQFSMPSQPRLFHTTLYNTPPTPVRAGSFYDSHELSPNLRGQTAVREKGHPPTEPSVGVPFCYSGHRDFQMPADEETPRWIEEFESWNYIARQAPLVFVSGKPRFSRRPTLGRLTTTLGSGVSHSESSGILSNG